MKAKTIVPKPPVRSIADILTEANSLVDLDAIIALWIEIANNKYQYCLDELRVANEKIIDVAMLSNGTYTDRVNFYMYFLKMGEDYHTSRL